jgi:DNA processing protein
MSRPSLDDRAVAAATLASLPHITEARLRRLFARFETPVRALLEVQHGRGAAAIPGEPDDAQTIAAVWARNADPDRIQRRLEARRTRVWIAGDADFPINVMFPRCPAVLFGEGDRPDALAAPCVAMVGTRSATPHGLSDAREIAAVLARGGVTVVSGLAIGIDGASHEGALDARGLAVGVVGTGLDVTYPRRHGALFARVREHGLLVSEYAYGVQPHRPQFPDRNRVIAALSHVCVVVEATIDGGAAITAGFANDYGRTVYALPGSRRNPAAAGCNALIQDGAEVLLDPGDILIALEQGEAGTFWQPPLPTPDHPDDARVLTVLEDEAVGVDQIMHFTALSSGRVAGALRRLEASGRVEPRRGRWWPR